MHFSACVCVCVMIQTFKRQNKSMVLKNDKRGVLILRVIDLCSRHC